MNFIIPFVLVIVLFGHHKHITYRYKEPDFTTCSNIGVSLFKALKTTHLHFEVMCVQDNDQDINYD